MATRREYYPHDQCKACHCASEPLEGVPDQALRVCPECEETWFEDLTQSPDEPDEAYERAAARDRADGFAKTGGKDWT